LRLAAEEDLASWVYPPVLLRRAPLKLTSPSLHVISHKLKGPTIPGYDSCNVLALLIANGPIRITDQGRFIDSEFYCVSACIPRLKGEVQEFRE
jgi:hypothetical protein